MIRTYVHDVLEKIYREITREESFESLELTVNEIIKTQEGERELEINCELWNEQAKQLGELVEYHNLEFEETRKKKIEIAQDLNAEIDRSIFRNGSKLGYVERWEGAQLEKQELKLSEKESELLRAKANCEKLEKADQIVSGEVKTYLEANTREMEDEIISWTSQYNEELERRQQEMSEFREHIMDQLLELNELKALKDSRQAFIDEVTAEKERLIREEEYWKGIHRAATIIQCQWRGYMVRKQIGPFKGLWLRLKRRKRGEGFARKHIVTIRDVLYQTSITTAN
ncbi:dynein regulatory complex protein 10-like [Athalia rosae]|uniref:dynein regulatory complex protein 10-like n=1 Tax=Athalia rosae TaxID=37344 RepID=UPI0020338FF9|nr:dynein regulatory complex protein 10-like [Athalia rosae]